jgi:hypothetical protein
MTAYRSDEDMRAFAKEALAKAEDTLKGHRRDGVGCCVSCGREAPCDAAETARLTIDHYRGWLGNAAVEGGGDGRSRHPASTQSGSGNLSPNHSSHFPALRAPGGSPA